MKKNIFKAYFLALLLSSSFLFVNGQNINTLLGNLTDYHLVIGDGRTDANWQGATKGYVGNVAVSSIADQRTSGTVPYAGTIFTNAASQGSWQAIVNANAGQASGIVTNETTRLAGLKADLNSAFTQINALTVTPGFENMSSTSLNGLNTANGINEIYVINVTSGLSVSSQVGITGDAGDIFILRWDTDANFANGYDGQVKFQSGGAIVPLGGLTAGNFIHVAGDINASGGGSNPAAPFPQGPRYNNGQGALITGGSNFNGGGFFTGYWLTTGNPDITDATWDVPYGESSSLSNAIFVGGWYTIATKFSMTSGTSGVYVAPPTIAPQASADLAVIKTANLQNPSVGNNITFTIVATNNGPSAATGVTVNDVLPSGYTLFSATTNNGSWTDPNWTIGNMASGGVATLNIIATVNSGGNYANTATISGTESDPNIDNNSSTSTPLPGPNAVNDNASTNLNTPVDITILENDLTGASPLNPGSITFVPGTTPPTSEGVFTVNLTTGVVIFTPAVGFTGTSTVNYQVCDMNSLCDVATIIVVVNTVAGPTANDDNATTNLNTPVDINVLTNDVAGATPLNPATVTFVPGTIPNPTTQGTFTANATTGLVTFTPVTGFTGTVTVDYQVCDQNVLCDIATITVIITPGIVGPTANNDQATTPVNTPVNINIIQNDVPGSATLNPTTVTFIAGTEPNPTTEGIFTVDPVTGLVTFTPANNYTGTVTIDYQICDLNSLCDIATITVIITPGIVGPTANNDQTTTLINTPVDLPILANDIEGSTPLVPGSITFISGTEPNPSTVGVFTVDLVTGIVTFTPANGYVGVATIDYQVCDQNALCDIATITVTIINGTSNLFPALGLGTLAFEDLWPGKGDYDFNDLVIDYQFEIISNASNFVEQVTATFVIRAFGASFENGFGFQLSGAINAADLNVTGFDLTENFITLAANGTEAGQSKPTIIVYDNAFAQMAHPGIGIGVNTEPNAPYVQPVTLTVNIDFKPNTYTINQLDISNFNPFLIVNKNRSHEVHLPNYPPTDLVDMSLFGQWEDASNPATGKYYVTVNNLPWAINIYESFDYPIEKQDILWVHLKFAEWAMSGGALFPDWYKNLTGYRNESLIYQVPQK
jgi:LruC domain-containing protein/uncharacterized repeat protein (TIGR01451 family)